MTKTPEEIKRGLECCDEQMNCDGCPYNGENDCSYLILKDGLSYIRKLETGIDEKNEQLMQLEEGSKKVMNMLSVVSDHSAAINKAAIHAIEQMANRIPRWISVEERLPEKHTGVIACCEDGYIAPMVYDGVHWNWNGKYEDSVTHWMPLPEPPKEDA